MGKVVASSSETPFANFIKKLNATDWVRQGHTHFAGQTVANAHTASKNYRYHLRMICSNVSMPSIRRILQQSVIFSQFMYLK